MMAEVRSRGVMLESNLTSIALQIPQNNDPQKIRWGILGLGKIAVKSMLPAFKFAHQAECVALGSREIAKAEKIAGTQNAKILACDYETLLQQQEVDAVYIALPNHMHAEWSIKALKAEKHVLCEKPLAMTQHEAIEMNAVAEKTGRILGEAFMYRYHLQHTTVKELIREKTIGEVRLFKAHFSYHLKDLSNIRLKPQYGGGAWMDVGCYGIDAARYILGEEPINCEKIQHLGKDSGVDESTSALLNFPNGIQAQIYCATNSYREQSYEVIGSLGKIEVREAFIPAGAKTSNIILRNEAGQQIFKHPGVNQYSLELDHFSQCIQMGTLVYPMENGLQNGKILYSQQAR
jgi:D-xylose 1-dehydrogenase (NADP+, D-xylono-1,5-lactone-forming)